MGARKSAKTAGKYQKRMMGAMKEESDLYRGKTIMTKKYYTDPVTGKKKSYKVRERAPGADEGYAGQNRDFYEGLAQTGEDKFFKEGEDVYNQYAGLSDKIGGMYEGLATDMAGRSKTLADDILGRYSGLADDTTSRYNALAGDTEGRYRGEGQAAFDRYFDSAAQGLRSTGYEGMMGILNKPNGVRDDAAYKFMQNEAETSTSRLAGARGMGNSSNVLNALQERRLNVADTYLNSIMNRYGAAFGLGETARTQGLASQDAYNTTGLAAGTSLREQGLGAATELRGQGALNYSNLLAQSLSQQEQVRAQGTQFQGQTLGQGVASRASSRAAGVGSFLQNMANAQAAYQGMLDQGSNLRVGQGAQNVNSALAQYQGAAAGAPLMTLGQSLSTVGSFGMMGGFRNNGTYTDADLANGIPGN
jgi:hypothetical protein